MANDLFDNNLTARLSFIDQVKEAVPEPVQFDEIDASRQLKKFENQKLSLSNGIELLFPEISQRYWCLQQIVSDMIEEGIFFFENPSLGFIWIDTFNFFYASILRFLE